MGIPEFKVNKRAQWCERSSGGAAGIFDLEKELIQIRKIFDSIDAISSNSPWRKRNGGGVIVRAPLVDDVGSDPQELVGDLSVGINKCGGIEIVIGVCNRNSVPSHARCWGGATAEQRL